MDIKQAVRELKDSLSVSEACQRLGVTDAALRSAFKRAGIGSPSTHLGISIGGKKIPGLVEINPPRRVLVCPDVHVPYHDVKAWNVFLAVLRSRQWDDLVFLGDFNDCYNVSSFVKSPKRKHSFGDEIQAGNDAADEVDEARGSALVHFLLGNHEDRLRKMIAERAPELDGLTSYPELLNFEERGWRWRDYGEQLRIGNIYFSHDYGSCGGRAVSQSLAATGHCVLFGHTHRASVEYSGTVDGVRHVGMTCGWLGDFDALAFDYVKKWKARREWQHGFATVTIDSETGNGWAQFHPIIDGKTVVDGKIISH